MIDLWVPLTHDDTLTTENMMTATKLGESEVKSHIGEIEMSSASPTMSYNTV